MDAHCFIRPVNRKALHPTIFDTAKQAAWLHAEMDGRLLDPAIANATEPTAATSVARPDLWFTEESRGIFERCVLRGDRFGPIPIEASEWREMRKELRGADGRLPSEQGMIRLFNMASDRARWWLSPDEQTAIVGPGPLTSWVPIDRPEDRAATKAKALRAVSARLQRERGE